jgi:hypothetical protein
MNMDNDLQDRLTFEFPGLDGNKRLGELILYISQKCADDPTFCATKLNKILFYSDFLSFFTFGKPIAGVEYQKLEHGPAPKQLLPVREELKRKGELAVEKRPFFDKHQHRCVALRDPDLEGFSGRDIAVIDAWIERFWGKTATEVSNLSHQRAWRIAKEGESIPYQAVYLSEDDCTAADVARVEELNRQHRWE